MPGPAPKHPDQRRRRNKVPQLVQLPAEGRKGRTPKWPLLTRNEAERHVWAEIWKTPQAAAWDRLGWARPVARYVRLIVQAETAKATATVLSETRQLEDRLGLTPMAMKRLGWEIVADEVGEVRQSRPAPRRLRAVDPSALARG